MSLYYLGFLGIGIGLLAAGFLGNSKVYKITGIILVILLSCFTLFTIWLGYHLRMD